MERSAIAEKVARYTARHGWRVGSHLIAGNGAAYVLVSRPGHTSTNREWRVLSYINGSGLFALGRRSSPFHNGAESQMIRALANGGVSLDHANRVSLKGLPCYPCTALD